MDAQIQDGEMVEEPTSSPLPEPVLKPDQLTFPQAIKEVINGKKITKIEWDNKNIYGYIAGDGHLKINLPDKLSDWVLSDGDLNGLDWVVLKEEN